LIVTDGDVNLLNVCGYFIANLCGSISTSLALHYAFLVRFVRNPRALEFMNRLPRVPRHLSQIFALDSGSLGVGVLGSTPVAMATKKKERAGVSRLLGAPTAALDMIRSLLVVDPKV